MKIHLLSICLCCNEKREKTLTNILWIASLANKIWRKNCEFRRYTHKRNAFTKINHYLVEIQIITTTTRSNRAMPTINVWTIWKRRNSKKHGGNTIFGGMVMQVQEWFGIWWKLYIHGYIWSHVCGLKLSKN